MSPKLSLLPVLALVFGLGFCAHADQALTCEFKSQYVDQGNELAPFTETIEFANGAGVYVAPTGVREWLLPSQTFAVSIAQNGAASLEVKAALDAGKYVATATQDYSFKTDEPITGQAFVKLERKSEHYPGNYYNIVTVKCARH